MTRNPVVLFFALTVPLAWVFWIPMLLSNRGVMTLPVPTLVWSTLGALSPLVALGIIERVSHRRVRLEAIMATIRLREWRSTRVLAGALFPFGLQLVLIATAFALEAARGTQSGILWVFKPEVFATLGWWTLPVMAIHFLSSLLTSPLFEEPGWRGFAFTELERRLPRDLASLIVGSYWWLWHQGMNLAFGLQPSWSGFLSMLLDSFMIDAFYTLSGRNLFAAMLAHQSLGTALTFLWPVPMLAPVLAVKLIAVAALRLRVQRGSRRPETVGASSARGERHAQARGRP